MSDPARPKVPTHDAASSERTVLEAMLAEEEARGQLLEAERASVRERVEVLRAKLASRDSPPAAHPENGAPRSPPRSAGENPEFYRRQSMRLSTAMTPRVISCAEDLPKHVALPRGCRTEVEELLRAHAVASIWSTSASPVRRSTFGSAAS